MFKKDNRLSTNFEYKITRKYGRKYNGEFFYLYVLKPQKYVGPTKIGIVVSNKVHKSATKRNRIKRLYRESLRTKVNEFGDNLWVVVYPQLKSLERTYEEISADVNSLLSKISIS